MRKTTDGKSKRTAKPVSVGGGGDDSAISDSASRKIGDFLKRKRAGPVGASVGVEPAATVEVGNGGDSKQGVTVGNGSIKGGVVAGSGIGRGGKRAGTGTGKRGLGVGRTGTGTGTAAGAGTGTGTAAGNSEAEVGENPVRGVVPGIKIGKQKKTKAEEKADAKFQASIMSSLLETLFVGLFASIAITTRQDHWQLTKQESSALSSQLNAALETLPPGSYEQIRKLTDKYVPWLGLVITAAAVVGPKIEASRIDRKAAKVKTGSNAGSAADGEWRNGFANPYRAGNQSDSERHSVPH